MVIFIIAAVVICPLLFAGANRKAGELVDGGIGTTLFRAEAEVIAKNDSIERDPLPVYSIEIMKDQPSFSSHTPV